jgi:phosphatidylserine decarboxylase
VLIFIVQFFKNPKRATIINDSNIISSVDGKVVSIEDVYEPEYFKDKRKLVAVFMSPLNVHVTRYPIGGIVRYSKYHKGKYLFAWHPKSSIENERTTIVVKSIKFGDVLFRQIAGAFANRIVNYAEVNKDIIQGKDSGFIKFGSRVDVYLPINCKIQVEIGQKVVGGETVIAIIK